MPSTERRRLLTAAAAALSVGTAGCAGLVSQSSDGSGDGSTVTAPTTGTSDRSGDGATGTAGDGTTGTAGDGATSGSRTGTATETGALALPSAVTSGDLPDGKVTLRPDGRVTLLNFFTTWCGPCKEEMPALRKLRAEYDESAFHLVSITPQVEQAVVESFWEKYDATWPVVTDSSLRATQRWDANSYPTNLLFDSDGEPAGEDGAQIRARTFDGFDALVSPLVSEE